MKLETILAAAVERSASDILLIAGLPVSYKQGGLITREGDRLTPEDTARLTNAIYEMANHRSLDRLFTTGDDDFSLSLNNLARFRVNAFKQRGSLSLIIRVVSFELPDPDVCGIPKMVIGFSDYSRGLILVTGPAGSGKTTTLACMVDHINQTRNAHVICIEDPIEYLHRHKQSVVSQRELNIDTVSYDAALRAALRQAPDVILLGEMRDPDTIRAAVTAAETGHLVISTLHTIGAANTIDRIIDSFPPQQQGQIRTQLALVLEGVASQQLLRTSADELVPAFEIMKVNSAIRNMIRESKAHQLDNVIGTSSDQGMVTMDQSIWKLVQAGQVSPMEARRHCINSEWMEKRLQSLSLTP